MGLFCYSFFNFLSWLLYPLLFKLSSFPIYAFKATKFSPHTGLNASHQFLQVILYYLVFKYFIIYIVISFLTHGLLISIYPYFQKSWGLENCIMIRGHTLYYFCPLKFIENCSLFSSIYLMFVDVPYMLEKYIYIFYTLLDAALYVLFFTETKMHPIFFCYGCL